MLERSRIWGKVSRDLAGGLVAAGLAACATPEPVQVPSATIAPGTNAATVEPATDPRALAEEARALLAQAETDILRARARRALWSKAWENLVGARASFARGDHAGSIRLSGRASELARLGLEQLAYPAVQQNATRSPP